MFVRQSIRPVRLLLSRCTTRGAASATDTPSDAVMVKAQRKYVLPFPDARPGPFASVFSDLLGERTGVTGVYTLGAGLLAFAHSKQIILLNEESHLLLPTMICCYMLVNTAVLKLGAMTERANIFIFDRLYGRKDDVVDILQRGIDAATSVETEVSVRKDVFNILRSNAAIYREALYRERADTVRQEIVKRLQHQADLEAARRRIKQAHMINWVEREVKNMATQLDNQAVMRACLDELQGAVASSAPAR